MSIQTFIYCGLLLVVGYVKSANQQEICRTPSRNMGQCIQFESCEKFRNISQKDLVTPDEFDLIEKSWCPIVNGVQRKICCPTKLIIPTESSTSNTELPTHPNINLLPPLNQCGQFTDKKIFIGFGQSTDVGEFPWMAILRAKSLNNQTFFYCGGTLISKRYVLTAAHCLRTIQGVIPLHSVILGEHDTTTNPDCDEDNVCVDPIQEIPVEQSIPHPNFSFWHAQHDIGLIRLQRVVEFSESISPICIPFSDNFQIKNHKYLIILGWGITELEQSSNVLLQAMVKLMSNSDCSNIYQTHNRRLQINEHMLCAHDNKSTTCAGDSGGPAIYPIITGIGLRTFQYGILSVGGGTQICGKTNGIPEVYTSVTSYLQWILDNISE